MKATFNETLWAVVASAAGHGIAEDVVQELIAKHFNRDPRVSEDRLTADIACMLERTRPRPRSRPMTFTGGGDAR
jgi:hypothetical protein